MIFSHCRELFCVILARYNPEKTPDCLRGTLLKRISAICYLDRTVRLGSAEQIVENKLLTLAAGPRLVGPPHSGYPLTPRIGAHFSFSTPHFARS